jgi:hypothetical protein
MQRRIQQDIIKKVFMSSSKAPVTLIRFQSILNFHDRFLEKFQMSNFIKIRPVRAELFYVDRQTDTTKLLVAFRNCERADKQGLLPVSE